MCTLDEKKGLDIGETYRNDKQAQIFIKFIAEVERIKLRNKLSDTKFVSLISDGTTDSSITEAEIVYIRYSKCGKINSHLVGVENVRKADAVSIKRAIEKQVVSNLGLEMEEFNKKLVGFGSDGANVMVGKNNGVAALLKREQPCLQSVHCMAHKLELAFKDALKNVETYTSLSRFLLSLYLFYHQSPLNRSNLKATFRALDLPSAIPSRTGGTRWLPHLAKALQKVIRGYPAIMLHLSQMSQQSGSEDQKAKARNFLNILRRRHIVVLIHLMMDVVQLLSYISLAAQARAATIGDVYHTMQSATRTLQKYKTRPSPKERDLRPFAQYW